MYHACFNGFLEKGLLSRIYIFGGGRHAYVYFEMTGVKVRDEMFKSQHNFVLFSQYSHLCTHTHKKPELPLVNKNVHVKHFHFLKMRDFFHWSKKNLKDTYKNVIIFFFKNPCKNEKLFWSCLIICLVRVH